MAQTPPPTGKKPVAKPAGNPADRNFFSGSAVPVAPRTAPTVNLVRPTGPASIQPNPLPKFVLGTNQNWNPLPQDIENLTRPAHFAPFRPGLFRQDALDAKFAQDLNRQGTGKALTPKKENFARIAQDTNRTDFAQQRKWNDLTLKDNLSQIIMGAVPKRFWGGGKELFELDDKMEPYAYQNEKWKAQHYPTYLEPQAFLGFGTWENALTHGGTSLNLANDVGFLKAMGLGLGHEYAAGDFDNLYNRALTAPQGFVNTKMDVWNNFVGAGIGALPNKLVSYPEKLKLLNWMLQNNMLSIVDEYDTRFRKRRTKIPHPYVEEPIVLPEDWYGE